MAELSKRPASEIRASLGLSEKIMNRPPSAWMDCRTMMLMWKLTWGRRKGKVWSYRIALRRLRVTQGLGVPGASRWEAHRAATRKPYPRDLTTFESLAASALRREVSSPVSVLSELVRCVVGGGLLTLCTMHGYCVLCSGSFIPVGKRNFLPQQILEELESQSRNHSRTRDPKEGAAEA